LLLVSILVRVLGAAADVVGVVWEVVGLEDRLRLRLLMRRRILGLLLGRRSVIMIWTWWRRGMWS
jgi:hypothetical protein